MALLLQRRGRAPLEIAEFEIWVRPPGPINYGLYLR